jgi:LEA14-like dessication related protein
MFRTLTAACILLLAASCGSMFKAPVIGIRGVNIKAADELEVTLSFFNPNRIAADAGDMEYQLTIDTFRCAQGRREELIHLGAQDSVLAEFPVRLDWSSLTRAVPSLLSDSVNYRVEGSYRLPRILGTRRLKFQHNQRLALRNQLNDLLRGLFR